MNRYIRRGVFAIAATFMCAALYSAPLALGGAAKSPQRVAAVSVIAAAPPQRYVR